MRMKRRSRTVRRILFPWEVRVGVQRWLPKGRLRTLLAGVGVVLVVGFMAGRERHASDVRLTRAALLDVRRGVDAYVADHDGGCPPNLGEVAPYLKRSSLPRDAWGSPLRLTCPGHDPGTVYNLTSDGPDGVPGGLDRID